MKIIYCTHSLCNPGGMERVLVNKVTYLVNRLHWDVSIVTTDQKSRPAFYPLPEGVKNNRPRNKLLGRQRKKSGRKDSGLPEEKEKA